jgi:linoleoyl-CoA desaturase
MTNKDFAQLIRYKKKDLLAAQNVTYSKAMSFLIISKLLYYVVIALIPLLIMDITWWQWLIGFFCMHFVSGSILAFIFQPAHVVPETSFVTVENHQEENPDESWAIHQMKTTANFENWNPILTWYVGGLNYQIEHHLFPDISHVHYPKISKIVKAIAEKHGVPYHYHKTWGGAIFSHLRLLNRLGRA